MGKYLAFFSSNSEAVRFECFSSFYTKVLRSMDIVIDSCYDPKVILDFVVYFDPYIYSLNPSCS